MDQFANKDGIQIIFDLIHVIQKNKQYLSDIDGAIGDGDHGINMNKGFTLCQNELQANPGNMAYGFETLSKILMLKIGGSMGPLYGCFFKSLAEACKDVDTINTLVFGRMLISGRKGIQMISEAKPGDKTIMDVLIPADSAYQTAAETGECFQVCLDKMVEAARLGRDTTKDMVAKLGRSSRLGERSRGVVDAGAASCCLILESMAVTINQLLTRGSQISQKS